MYSINLENSTAIESTRNFDLKPSESKNSRICKAMGLKCHRMGRVKKNKKKKKDFILDSGESFEKSKSHSYGHNKKKSYNKENKFEKGKKGSYERTYKFKDNDMKKELIKFKQPMYDESEESVENLKHRKNKKDDTKKQSIKLKQPINEEKDNNMEENLDLRENKNDDMKKQSLKLEQPINEESDKSVENVELRKNKKRGSKKIAYHNVFMKDEYKKDHTLFW